MVVNQISLNSSAIVRALGGVALLLVLISVGGQLLAYRTGPYFYKFVRLFHVDGERNVPTGFAVFLLLFAALLLAVITVIKRQQTDSQVMYWAILSCGFLLMAADEAWTFHEELIPPLRRLLGGEHLGVFYFAWVLPGSVLVLVLALFFSGFLMRLPAKTRFTFLMAAMLYIGGAIGLELIGGRFVELHGPDHFRYTMIVAVEESLEMAGAILFIRALLGYIADHYQVVRFYFSAV
jgi:hypothetical protein